MLDTDGRLVRFEAVPPQVRSDEAIPSGRVSPDWGLLMAESRFDPAGWTPVEPRRNPRLFADSVAAWNVRLPQAPDILFRVEAAAYGGRLVSAELLFGLESAAPAWFGYPPALVLPIFNEGALQDVATPAEFAGQMLFDMSFMTLGIPLAAAFLLVLLG